MKRILIPLMFVVTLCACRNDGGSSAASPRQIWVSPMTELHNISGNVSALTQSIHFAPEEGEEDMQLLVMQFDNDGCVTYCNPTGTGDATTLPQSRVDVSFGQNSQYFGYTYDSQHRLTSIEVYEIGTDEPTLYTITYSDHSLYTFAPCQIGMLDMYMIQGVEQIIGSNGYTLNVDVHARTVTEQTPSVSFWNQGCLNIYSYAEDSLYPTSATIANFIDEPSIPTSTATATYTWSDNGYPLSTSIATDYGGDVERVDTEYAVTSAVPAQPLTVTTYFNNERMSIFRYSYDSSNRALKGQYTYPSATYDGSIYPFDWNYASSDEHGNWTQASYTLATDSPITWVRQYYYR